MIATNEMVLIAVVDPETLVLHDEDDDNDDENSSTGVYEYTADIYYKQFSNNNGTYTKDAKQEHFKASLTGATLITQWDLSTLGLPVVVLPCINKGSHFESLITTPFPAEGGEMPEGEKKGDILHWVPAVDGGEDSTTGEWVVSEVGEPAVGDVVVWDGNKYVKKPITDLVRYDKTSHQLQVLVGSTWTMITGGQAVSFP